MARTTLQRFLRNHWDHCAAGALILLAVTQQAAWLMRASAVETWDDDAGLYRLATCLEDQLRGSSIPCFAGAPYPPLIPGIAALHFLATGDRGLGLALHSLWPWTVLLGLALWLGVRREAGSWAGLAAVALGPVVVWSLHIRGKFYTEVPLAAIALACMVAWVACERFQRRRPAVILGVLLGLGLMAKWSFGFFLGPPMALAWALGWSAPVRNRRAAALLGAAVLGCAALLVAGASGRLLGGLWPGFGIGLLAAGAALAAHRRRPAAFAEDAGQRWKNLALATAALLIVAGPWYLLHLGQLQAFLADNLAQKFHGDPIGALEGLSFYPSVLLTRVLGTPLAALVVLGGVLALRPGRAPLATWCLFGLASGALILGLLPYRSGRYLVAGLGLVLPLAILGLARLPRAGTALSVVALLAGVTHQLSWIPLGSGQLRVPHHWPIFTLPEQDLFGNSREGIQQATRDLARPRWRFLPVASPPVEQTPAARRLIQATAEAAPGPFFLVVLDPAGRVNANSLQTELLTTRPSPLSAATGGDVQPTATSLAHWTHQARHPPDSPATAQGDASRWLYIATVTPPDDPSLASRVEDLQHLLSSRDWTLVLEETIPDPFEPTQVQVWEEPR